MRVTAYCSCEKCCGIWALEGINKKGERLTASGAKAEGLIIAAPKNIPFGTKVYVPGYGLATVEDRGSAIVENKLDVFFGFDPKSSCPPHEKALNWGVRYVNCIFFKENKDDK